MEKKNYGKSVRTRLVNLMNETGYKYMGASRDFCEVAYFV